MNWFVMSLILSTVGLMGCSHQQNSSRIPAGRNDVGVIGPQSAVVIYYGENDLIVLKKCNDNTVLDDVSAASLKASCQGKKHRIKLNIFKKELLNLISLDMANKLKPFTKEEIKEFLKVGISLDDYNELVKELADINRFISSYGPKNADLIRKNEIEEVMKEEEKRIGLIKRIKGEIDKLVSSISANTQIKLIKYSEESDNFEFNLLKKFHEKQRFPCGQVGSLEDRSKDCYDLASSDQGHFVLVSRTMDFIEIYRDLVSGFYWSDTLPKEMTFVKAKLACKTVQAQFAGISEIQWRLPSLDEYDTAKNLGMFKKLPNTKYDFWTRSTPHWSTNEAWIVEGNWGGIFRASDFNNMHSVRCIGELKK